MQLKQCLFPESTEKIVFRAKKKPYSVNERMKPLNPIPFPHFLIPLKANKRKIDGLVSHSISQNA